MRFFFSFLVGSLSLSHADRPRLAEAPIIGEFFIIWINRPQNMFSNKSWFHKWSCKKDGLLYRHCRDLCRGEQRFELFQDSVNWNEWIEIGLEYSSDHFQEDQMREHRLCHTWPCPLMTCMKQKSHKYLSPETKKKNWIFRKHFTIGSSKAPQTQDFVPKLLSLHYLLEWPQKII